MNAPKQILIVDDESFNCELLEVLVESFGHCAQTATSGAQALAMVNEKTDLVLLDAMMPGIDGFEVARRIRANPLTLQTPIIMITALTGKEDKLKAVEAGANDFISKPIDRVELQVRAASLLKMKEARDAVAEKQAQLELQNEMMRADLNLARAMQLAYILKPYPVFPREAQRDESLLRFCHRYIPASILGGDFFDVLQLSDTHAGIFICDVMGHGVRSALVTAMIRAVVGDTSQVAASPELFLAAVNRHLSGILDQSGVPMFASALYGVIDLEKSRLTYAVAGHPSPILVRQSTNTTTWLFDGDTRTGPALGLFPEATYLANFCDLIPEDLLLIYTDGLVEVQGEWEEFGEERLLPVVESCRSLAPEQLCDELLLEITDFSASGSFDDDVCLLAIEVPARQPVA